MAKDKKKQDKQRQKAKQRREHRKAAGDRPSEAPVRSRAPVAPAPFTPRIPLDPPVPERCLAPGYLDAAGRSTDDPYAVLGLPPGERAEPVVQEAWKRNLRAHPPERDPEGARRALEARQRLTDPTRVVERELGVVHLPDPAAWGFAAEAAEASTGSTRLSSAERLVGQALLYALLEDHIQGLAPAPGAQASLFPMGGGR